MIDDKFYLGNVAGLLKNGRWNLSADEANVLAEILKETLRRMKAASELKESEQKPEAQLDG